ncbi:hypothetical protein [Natronobacterium gregoryi]|uniref:Heat shock protein HtpX n=1 Tax=Natronobacterium gregoryi (strain ATCC 43098 / DSM 3393 / CCM 3738 / CIP 104747 / IAM 13177 / JCM 8860 / NBRC 102187 / NCIMB 2189 / SP2) TaxID=797304 RepID=L9YLJ6_NATGS|nr:hypothetical protein [Natronobacterium gregoryi]ELY74377.1 hypothetical protein C490_00380 [Natronobacterium gregoryi SP2]PLK21475.1 hypothetical protein CYV19_04040 [Natronobacterium gregoryi SP2]
MEDLREAASVSSLSILPLERRDDRSPADAEPVPDDRPAPIRDLFFATHPQLECRLVELRELEKARTAAPP